MTTAERTTPDRTPAATADGRDRSRSAGRFGSAARRLAAGVLGAGLIGSLLTLGTTEAEAGPRDRFQMPFPCKQTWNGATYSGHGQGNQGTYALDLNSGSGNDDLGRKVVASLGGTLHKHTGSPTYGKYVYIDHGNGWRTMYAHLRSIAVSDGSTVSRGQKIGRVGKTGNADTTHLHYEQQRIIRDQDGTPWEAVHIHFNGGPLNPGYSTTYNGPAYTSRNC